MSEKTSKGMFLKPEKLQHHSNEGKRTEKKKGRGVGKEEKRERERKREREKKTMVALLGFIMATLAEKKLLDAKGPFSGNVIKNPARYIRPKILKT